MGSFCITILYANCIYCFTELFFHFASFLFLISLWSHYMHGRALIVYAVSDQLIVQRLPALYVM